MRICSFLPSATEIVYALGLGEQLCKPVVIRSRISDGLSSAAIHAAVLESMRRGEGLYTVDVEQLARLQPDLIITQRLCAVCAVSDVMVEAALRRLPHRPAVLSLHPHAFQETLDDIRCVGQATGTGQPAEALLRGIAYRLNALRVRLRTIRERPRVFCWEWIKPPMASGHWVPEMVELAGGQEVLGRAREPSRVVSWEAIAASAPEVIVLMPCGVPMERVRQELDVITRQPLWRQLPAVQAGRVVMVDGPSYFNCSGPRLIDGIEILAGICHPELFSELIPPGAVEWVPIRTG